MRPDHNIIPLILLILIQLSIQCPTNETLYSYCSCESSYNGIILDCSNKPAVNTLPVLQFNQIQLGLIHKLTLRNSSLQELPGYFLKGLYVKQLDVSQNQLQSVNERAFEGLGSIVQSLNISRNRLELLPSLALDGLDALLELDLSNNQIGDLDTKQALRNLPKLYSLDLSHNQICSTAKSAFDGVKRSLATLNLGNNCLTAVPASALRGFQRLLALHLHSNSIGNVEPLAFMNLPQLNLINLAANNIESIHKQAFLNVPQLRLLYASDNRLSSLSEHSFRQLATIEMLDLTRNQLRSIPSGAFAGMQRLQQVYLGENQISTIEDGAFLNSSLTALLMPSNRLAQLNARMLEGLDNLQQLSFKDNQIASISPNTFHSMGALVMLDLSGNQIRSLPPAAFLAQLQMFLLDLSGNQLATVPYNSFNKRIVTVLLQENPLVCRERVHMLQNGVGLFIQDSQDLVCGGRTPPPNHKLNNNVDGALRRPSLIQPQSPNPQVRNPNQQLGPVLEGHDHRPFNAAPTQNTGSGANNVPNNQGGQNQRTSAFIQDIQQPQPSGNGIIRPAPGSVNLPSRFQPLNSNQITPDRPRALSPSLVTAATPTRPTTQGARSFGIPNNFAPRLSVPGDAAPRVPSVQFPPQTRGPVPITRPPVPQTAPPRQETPKTIDLNNYGEYDYGNPNVDGFAIPFLSHNPVAPAFAQTTAVPLATLPPGIIIATRQPPPASLPPWTVPDFSQTQPPPVRQPGQFGPQPGQPPVPRPDLDPRTNSVTQLRGQGALPNEVPPQQPSQFPLFNNGRPQETLPGLPPGVDIPAAVNSQSSTPDPRQGGPPPKKNSDSTDDNFKFESDASIGQPSSTASATGATTTIVVCVSVVVGVMAVVFVTLCVVRHRVRHSASRRVASSSSSSSAAAARTSAYVAAQAAFAQQHYGTQSMNPTATRPNINGSTLPKHHGANGAQHTWIYTPGSYSSASNYYK